MIMSVVDPQTNYRVMHELYFSLDMTDSVLYTAFLYLFFLLSFLVYAIYWAADIQILKAQGRLTDVIWRYCVTPRKVVYTSNKKRGTRKG